MIEVLSKSEGRERMNLLGTRGEPFFFLIDFDKKAPIVMPLSEIDSTDLWYNLNGITNQPFEYDNDDDSFFCKEKVEKTNYRIAFNTVMNQIRRGNSYLLNLTFPTKVETNLSLRDIYLKADAPFKLWLRNRFAVFSPEPFVKIEAGRISTFPMKGTIDANIPNSKNILQNDLKEIREHATIVDLLRNDLSRVAVDVQVKKYRYFDKIPTNGGALWQTSSSIEGKLPDDFQKKLGDIIFKLLPAGSISGAPKIKTLEIIRAVEPYQRGYYTGVFGVFDGKKLSSGVAIRFIEKEASSYVFKSGGGITCMSDCEEEYQELIDKVYLPFSQKKYVSS